MGLIQAAADMVGASDIGVVKAGLGALGGVLADQWKEFFYCDSLDADTLLIKGQKRQSSRGRSANTKGEDNIISNGSGIAVADGQCMLIVESGEIVDVCAVPGYYTYDQSTEPSIFTGDLGDSIKASFQQFCRRFTFGGDPGKDQRVYYVNTKEITGNKYGTPQPIPFRVVDANVGLDIDIAVRCNGVYSYHIIDPVLFYKKVAGNVDYAYKRSQIDDQLKSELLTALQPAFAQISAQGVRYSAVPAHTTEIRDALNTELSQDWTRDRGLEIVNFGINTISASEEDEKLIKQVQTAAAYSNASLGAGRMAAATANAMETAAGNENGAMNAFMGMGMAGMAGGMNASNLYAQAAANPYQQPAPQSAAAMGFASQSAPAPAAAPAVPVAPAAGSWTCACGSVNTGKFCPECGSPKPSADWTCTCGMVNTGKFCPNCGSPRP